MWHTVLSYVEDGKRIEKWKTTGLPLANNKRRAQEIANERACKFRKLAEEKNRMEDWGLDTSVPDMLFSDLMQQRKLRKAPAISKSTLEGYEHILHYAGPVLPLAKYHRTAGYTYAHSALSRFPSGGAHQAPLREYDQKAHRAAEKRVQRVHQGRHSGV